MAGGDPGARIPSSSSLYRGRASSPVGLAVSRFINVSSGDVFYIVDTCGAVKRGKDDRKYTSMGAAYPKRRLVLAVIEHCVATHPGLDLDGLQRASPKNIHQASKQMFVSAGAIPDEVRYFSKPADHLVLKDGTFAPSNQAWGVPHLEVFLKHVREHFSTAEVPEIAPAIE